MNIIWIELKDHWIISTIQRLLALRIGYQRTGPLQAKRHIGLSSCLTSDTFLKG